MPHADPRAHRGYLADHPTDILPRLFSGFVNNIEKALTNTNVRTILKVMTKGEDTRRAILDAGLKMATQLSLESVTIGNLAKATQISKSGLFAHFQSKENLQLAILKHAGDIFAESVVVPALMEPAGIPRIKALVANWRNWSARMPGGCIFVSASAEFADRPGNVHDYILAQQEEWIDSLRRIAHAAIQSGDFKKDADCDQFAFDLYSMLLGFHYYHQLLRDNNTVKRHEKALADLLNTYRVPSSDNG